VATQGKNDPKTETFLVGIWSKGSCHKVLSTVNPIKTKVVKKKSGKGHVKGGSGWPAGGGKSWYPIKEGKSKKSCSHKKETGEREPGNPGGKDKGGKTERGRIKKGVAWRTLSSKGGKKS